jgi:hypothetical protein
MSVSGKFMQAKIGGMAPVAVVGNYAWSAEENAEELDRTEAETEGFEDTDDGVWSLTVNLKGFMDIADGSYTPVRRGTLITDLKLFRDKDDATPAFVIPKAKVYTSTQGGEVKGKVEWTARIKAKGSYTYNDP